MNDVNNLWGAGSERPEADPLEDLIESMQLAADAEGAAMASELRRLVEIAQARATSQAMAALRSLSDALTGALVLDDAARVILDHAIRGAGAERGILFLGSEQDEKLRPALARSLDGGRSRSWAGSA